MAGLRGALCQERAIKRAGGLVVFFFFGGGVCLRHWNCCKHKVFFFGRRWNFASTKHGTGCCQRWMPSIKNEHERPSITLKCHGSVGDWLICLQYSGASNVALGI